MAKYDAELIKQQNDLRDIVARCTTLRRASHDELCGPCPRCGGTDRLHVTATWFFCRQCHERRGDIFEWFKFMEGLDFLTTCKNLAGDILSQPKRKAEPARKLNLGIPDDDDLQSRVMQIAVDCAAMLWEPEGTRALAWLNGRGLKDDILKEHFVGFNREAGRLHRLYVPRGITIPHYWPSLNTISGIKIRLSTNRGDKYRSVAGSRPSLYLADYLIGHNAAVICEGEFDALLLHQEAGDLAGVCALGSASNKDTAIDAGLPFLLHCKRLLVATDSDEKGEDAAAAVMERTRRARRLHVPEGNDVTDFWKAGGDLRAWVSGALDLDPDPLVEYAENLGGVVVGVQTR